MRCEAQVGQSPPRGQSLSIPDETEAVDVRLCQK